MVAARLGRKRLVAGSTSGQQGLAVAVAAAHLGLECTVYMRSKEENSQGMRARLIRRVGAELKTLPSKKTPFLGAEAQYADVLKAVRDAALKDWLENLETTQFVNGLAAGPEPFPTMLHDFHAGTGRAARKSLVSQRKKLPGVVISVLDGSLDPLNFFHPFLAYKGVRLVGVENEAAKAFKGRPPGGLRGGEREMFFSDNQMAAADMILHAQGFPSTRREHAWLRETRRVDYLKSVLSEAENALERAARAEGILASDASGHALAQALHIAADMPPKEAVVVLVEHTSESQPRSLT
jgi:tryptophan synthase beta chain